MNAVPMMARMLLPPAVPSLWARRLGRIAGAATAVSPEGARPPARPRHALELGGCEPPGRPRRAPSGRAAGSLTRGSRRGHKLGRGAGLEGPRMRWSRQTVAKKQQNTTERSRSGILRAPGSNTRNKTMFAVIKTGGKQYRVATDDVLQVEKIAGNPGDVVEFAEVLVVGGDTPQLGTPTVSGAIVAG